jgi:2,4-dichlorophenol 6-monooxygenase
LTGKGLFTVVTGLAGTAWQDAARSLDLPFLRIVTTGSQQAQDLYFEWQRVREIEEAGALLVRPDGVIAWRSRDGAEDVRDAAEKLSAAICAVLDLPSLAAIPREGQAGTSKPGGTQLFA